MTDPSKDIDIDAFIGGYDETGESRRERQVTHYVGDDCPPDGHRSEAIVPSEHLAAEEALLAAAQDAAESEAEAAVVAKSEPAPNDELTALIYRSHSGDHPHVVIRLDVDVTCTCKAAQFNLPRGCWAMVHARTVLGLPAQETNRAAR